MEFDKYVKTHNIFDTSFAASKKSSLPELGETSVSARTSV